MDNYRDILPHLKLRFTVDKPTLEDCYIFGYESAQQGVSEDENPFTEDSREYEFWQEGWWTAFYDDEPLYKNDILNIALEEKPVMSKVAIKEAANDIIFKCDISSLLSSESAEIGSAVVAAVIVGYQLLELVI